MSLTDHDLSLLRRDHAEAGWTIELNNYGHIECTLGGYHYLALTTDEAERGIAEREKEVGINVG